MYTSSTEPSAHYPRAGSLADVPADKTAQRLLGPVCSFDVFISQKMETMRSVAAVRPFTIVHHRRSRFRFEYPRDERNPIPTKKAQQ